MMDEKDNYVRIGAWVAAFGIAALAVLLLIITAQFADEFDYFRISFKGPVTGLGVGTYVRYNGIDVGSVSQMAQDTVDPQRVLFTVKVRQGLNIRQDSVATIDTASLLGGARFVEIAGGTRSAPIITVVRLPPYPFIRSKDGGFAQIEQTMPQISKKIDTLMMRYRDVTGAGNRRAVDSIGKNYSRVSKVFERSDFQDIQSSYKRAAKNLSAENLNTDRTAKVVTQTSQKFARLGADAQKISDGPLDSLFTQLINAFHRLTKNVDALGDRIKKKPLSFLTGDKQKGYDTKPAKPSAQ